MALQSPLTVQPYDYIADSNGRPLDKGRIYIGVANQDPEFYQIPVYLDAAMTKPIDQPIRTNDGFVDFAGSLSELYASAEVYSVKVLDKQGRKVLYKGDMTRKNLMSDALADLNQSIIDTQTAAQITLNAAVNSANTEVAQTVSLATAAIDTATTKSNKAATDADAAIKTLFENGGLPAAPFKTKALMTASSLANDKYAMVTDDTANNGLYVKTSGAWVKSAYDPLTQAVADSKTYTDSAIDKVDAIDKVVSSLFTVADASGNKAVDFKSPVIIDKAGSIGTVSFDIGKNESLKYVHTVADASGNILYGVNKKGQLVADFSLVDSNIESEKTSFGYDSEVNHIFTYGQSLSVGQTGTALSTSQNYDNIMFVRGMRPQYDYPSETPSEWYASFSPAVETRSAITTSLAETPSMGTGDAIKQLILDEDSLSYTDMTYQIMLSASGYGATTIAQLSKGGVHYNRTIDQAVAAKSLATAQSKSYQVQAITWTQGESDALIAQTKDVYTRAFNELVSDFNKDIKQDIGQTKDIRFISYQMASHKVASQTIPNVALAQLDVSITNPLVFIATPMYHFDYLGTNDFHLTPTSSRWLGAYYGLAYKRVVIDGLDWQPVRPVSSMKSGNFVNIRFNVPSGKLVIDTTLVTENTNYGFELVTRAGVALPITSVSVVNNDIVKITSSSTIPDGAKVRYAWSGTDNVGRTSGARGNLRDTQGDLIIFDATGINKAMHNWCVIFEQEI